MRLKIVLGHVRAGPGPEPFGWEKPNGQGAKLGNRDEDFVRAQIMQSLLRGAFDGPRIIL